MNDYYQYEQYQRPQYVRSARITWGVQRLILLNTLVFAGQLLVDIPLGGFSLHGTGLLPPGGIVNQLFAFQPSAFAAGALWKPFTYMFLHGGLMHLFLNMLWLFFFGPDVERALGTRQFIRFYVLCGAVAVLATFVTRALFGHAVSVTGASGAVMGIMVAFAMANPEREFFLFPFPFRVNARALVIIVVGMNVLTALQPGGNTSVATHFGGMLVGYGYMKAMPRFRRWQLSMRRRQSGPRDPMDAAREAVDNIFEFEEKKRPR